LTRVNKIWYDALGHYDGAGMSSWVIAMRLVGVGFFIGICLLLGVLAGLWLDDRVGTKPVFMLLGLFLGLLFAGYGVYQMLIPLLKKQNNGENG